jgi:hypothetical protein
MITFSVQVSDDTPQPNPVCVFGGTGETRRAQKNPRRAEVDSHRHL